MTEEGATDGHRIAPVEDLPDGGTARFEATAGRRQIEGVLKRDGTAVVGYRNSCPHEPEVKLDRGLGALVDGDQLVCHKHGARFDCADGYCTRGPPRGRSLDTIEVTVRDGTVFLTDDRFDGVRRID